MKIQHDGDGKIFHIKDGKVVWIVECDIESGDAVAKAFTMLTDDLEKANQRKVTNTDEESKHWNIHDAPGH